MIDASEWEFVASNGIFMIGKRSGDKRLAPVFEVIRPVVPVPMPDGSAAMSQGFMIRAFLSVPPGIRSIELPDGALRVNLTALPKPIEDLVEQALRSDAEMRRPKAVP